MGDRKKAFRRLLVYAGLGLVLLVVLAFAEVLREPPIDARLNEAELRCNDLARRYYGNTYGTPEEDEQAYRDFEKAKEDVDRLIRERQQLMDSWPYRLRMELRRYAYWVMGQSRK